MSAFPNSGHSDLTKITKTTVRFRPQADVPLNHSSTLILQSGCHPDYLNHEYRLQGCGTGLIDKLKLEVSLRSQLFQQSVGATVTIMRSDQQLARLDQLQNQVYRGHAGGGD